MPVADIANVASQALGGAGGGSSGIDGAKAAMEEAFNTAIANSAEITKLTTEKKVELDAAKQRPNG